jgi:CheY-like chemotaxis protein
LSRAVTKILTSPGKAPSMKRRVFEIARRNQRRARARSLRLVTADHNAEVRPAILLAYHGKEVRQLLTAMLLRRGYDVTSCDDGRAAFRQLASAHFDLIITGIVMPNMDGLELIRTLRGHHSPPPILAVADESDRMSEIYLRNATLFGALSTHFCPVEPTALLTDVDWILWARSDVMLEGMW